MLKQRFLRISVFVLTALLLLVILLAVLVPLLFENRIKTLFISELNQNLATEVVVNTDQVDLKVLRYFPYASLSFEDIGIRESVPGSEQFFLNAEHIHLLFNLLNIFRKDYTISRVIVSNADIHLKTDKKGQINYRFWKESKEPSSEGFQVNLTQLTLEQVHVLYNDQPAQLLIETDIKKGNLSGNFSDTRFDLKVQTSFVSEQIRLGSDSYLVQQPVELSGQLQVDTDKEIYRLTEVEAFIASNLFELSGLVQLQPYTYLDIQVDGSKLKLHEVFALLPPKYSGALSQVVSEGNLEFHAAVKGRADKGNTPHIEAGFELQKGTLYHEAAKDKLKDVEIAGTYTNGAQNKAVSSLLQITRCVGEFGGNPLQAQLSYHDFNDPFIDLSVTGILPASLILPALYSGITDVQGVFLIENLHVNGHLKSLQAGNPGTTPPSGKLAFTDVVFQLGKEKVTLADGILTARGDVLDITGLKATGFGTDIVATLQLENWLNVFQPGSGLGYQIQGEIRFSSLDLNRLLDAEMPSSPPSSISTSATSVNKKEWWEYLSGKVDVSMVSFAYQDLKLDNLEADVFFSGPLMAFRDVKGKTRLGDMNLNGTFRRLPGGNFQLEQMGIVRQIDIGLLFDAFDQFGQDELTSDNLKGKADVYLETASMQFDQSYNLLLPSVYVLAGVHIQQGELLNYKPLEELSGYIDVDELKHIRFNDMQNQIEIKNQTIHIPAMEIQSSALNLNVSGTHTFDNQIDYKFKVRLGEILAGKFIKKSKNRELFEPEQEGSGINIYVSMTGTVEKPIIEVNKKDSKAAFEEGEEKGGILDIFKPDDNERNSDPVFRHTKPDPVETDTLEFLDWEDE